jgi:hypothetical protein
MELNEGQEIRLKCKKSYNLYTSWTVYGKNIWLDRGSNLHNPMIREALTKEPQTELPSGMLVKIIKKGVFKIPFGPIVPGYIASVEHTVDGVNITDFFVLPQSDIPKDEYSSCTIAGGRRRNRSRKSRTSKNRRNRSRRHHKTK